MENKVLSHAKCESSARKREEKVKIENFLTSHINQHQFFEDL